MSATTDILGMDRPLEVYVERWRKRQAAACTCNRRLAQQARQDARHIAAMLRQKFGVTRIILFGSLMTDRFSAKSDIDLAVADLAPADYFPALAEAGKLSDFPVDLKPLEVLVPHVRDRILEHGYKRCNHSPQNVYMALLPISRLN
ncbi:MAG: nucleotidyltransferase domain-containing protein [Roseiflexus sp.]|jgi:predicted nucleotidyltransferase|nr:nucleotidyltransferase domain-containing protein [Roseiflexus sp.]MBO9389040.1 nucleotidyltransferase domain-containing protein [Roseiflexus sp.]